MNVLKRYVNKKKAFYDILGNITGLENSMHIYYMKNLN
jgi:hypothetical protein